MGHMVLYDKATISGEYLAGNKRGFFGSKKCDCMSNVGRGAQTTERCLNGQFIQNILAEDLNHIGVNDSGSNAVNTDMRGS